MANTFITMVNRIASELTRSNMTAQIKSAINDAIAEAAQTRFYFNEMRGATFPTVNGTEYYSDLGLTEIDAMWFFQGSSRQYIRPENDLDANYSGTPQLSDAPISYSRAAGKLRIYPTPNAVFTIYADGYGALTPSPLVADTDTNAWMTDGEAYIRALAKAYVWRDVIRDYAEATVWESVAEDRMSDLLTKTALRASTGILQATQF